jgi:segregation and condensation protein A
MSNLEQFSRFFEVKLELFDGPIDLLLHLVKKRELPIEKLSLSEVTTQYLECIRSLTYYDVELAAEYLVIAATLLSVKASVLLNDPVELVVDESGALVDPHEELLRRLKELERVRAAAEELGNRPLLGSEVFAPPSKGVKIDPTLIPLADHQSELLVQAFQRVLQRLGEKARVFSITIDAVSVVERMRTVVDSVRALGGRATFSSLFKGAYDRATAIGIFIALLELCKRRMVSVNQDAPRGEISISLAHADSANNDSAGTLAANQDVAVGDLDLVAA